MYSVASSTSSSSSSSSSRSRDSSGSKSLMEELEYLRRREFERNSRYDRMDKYYYADRRDWDKYYRSGPMPPPVPPPLPPSPFLGEYPDRGDHYGDHYGGDRYGGRAEASYDRYGGGVGGGAARYRDDGYREDRYREPPYDYDHRGGPYGDQYSRPSRRIWCCLKASLLYDLSSLADSIDILSILHTSMLAFHRQLRIATTVLLWALALKAIGSFFLFCYWRSSVCLIIVIEIIIQ